MARIANGHEGHGSSEHLTPSELLHAGYAETLRDRTIYAGGSTACVGVAREDGVLDVAK